MINPPTIINIQDSKFEWLKQTVIKAIKPEIVPPTA